MRSSKTKKYICHAVAFFVLTICSFVLCACTTAKYLDVVDGVYTVGYGRYGQNAFAAEIIWKGDKNAMCFTVPDEYKGYKIANLGGYYGRGLPCPFGVVADASDYYGDFLSFDDCGDSEYETLIFTVRLGKNIEKIVRVYTEQYIGKYLSDEKDEVDVLCKIQLFFVVDSENAVFYSQDGVLYYKSNGEIAA